jgi:hypothetical protein
MREQEKRLCDYYLLRWTKRGSKKRYLERQSKQGKPRCA